MSIKLLAAAVAAGHELEGTVAAACRDAGVSRKTFYKYVNRAREEGPVSGLEERSRRPHHSPHQISVDAEDRIVRLRKELEDAGLDHGATTIEWHLQRERDPVVASVATIHRTLVRRGLVVPEPKKRPKASWRRFEAPAPNELWQIDHTDWETARGIAKVFNIVDDHSRVAARSRAVTEATTDQAWTTFCQATGIWGLPVGVLSDNGLCFSGRLRGFEVFFETKLRDAGIKPITGRPYHPQTTGKVERFQQTQKKWLQHQPQAADLTELQTQLDRFCLIYNTQRPHQGIGRVTPISRWQATPIAGPAAQALAHPDYPSRTLHATVDSRGVVVTNKWDIHIGAEWEHRHATIITDNHRANVFIDDHLIRHLLLDPNRHYQPSGRRRGGPRRPRLQS